MGRKEPEPARLKSARDRFSKWRKTRKGNSRIPQSLWRLATDLGREYGVSPTSRVLGLSYSDLKKHVSKEQSDEQCVESSFMEIPFSRSSLSHCSVELENNRGWRLKVELKGGVFPDVSELVKIFCREKI